MSAAKKGALIAILFCAPPLAAADGTSAVRARLADTAAELKTMAARGTSRCGGSCISPTNKDLHRFALLKPWGAVYRYYGATERMYVRPLPQWPAPEDAWPLRALLSDRDPAVRALSAEALGSLTQVEDAPRLAKLLSDPAPAAPTLGESGSAAAPSIQDGESVNIAYAWRQEQVRDKAAQALELITGEDFRRRPFDLWWEKNRPARQRLWYWQSRLRRELRAIERDRRGADDRLALASGSAGGYQISRARLETDEAEWRRRSAEARRRMELELRELSPEDEAKIRLLLWTGIDTLIAQHDPGDPLFSGPAPLRLSESRLLDLLEGKGRWPEIEWDEQRESLLIERLCRPGSPILRPAHLDRLRGRLSRTEDSRQRTVLILAIARLLPAAASSERSDDPETRDGWLRRAVRDEKEPAVRNSAIEELVRSALNGNRRFLEEAFFEDAGAAVNPGNDIKQTILAALGRPPLTSSQRHLLCKLVLDPRFEKYWTRPSRFMGDDMWRKYAIWSLNAHAGKDLIAPQTQEEYALTEPKTSAAALAAVLAKVRDLDRRPD